MCALSLSTRFEITRSIVKSTSLRSTHEVTTPSSHSASVAQEDRAWYRMMSPSISKWGVDAISFFQFLGPEFIEIQLRIILLVQGDVLISEYRPRSYRR